MSDEFERPDLHAMDIGQLRKYASHARVALSKTATKQEIIEALDRKLNGKVIPTLADGTTELKPGYARIKILPDPMPDSKNLPVYLNCNTSTFWIPRDVEVVVPLKVIRTLQDATVMRRKQSMVQDQHGREMTRETQVKSLSYPYIVLDIRPGPDVLNAFEIAKQKTAGPKRRYKEMFGRWPRPAELTRAIEQRLIKLTDDETLDPAAEALLSTSNMIQED